MDERTLPSVQDIEHSVDELNRPNRHCSEIRSLYYNEFCSHYTEQRHLQDS